MIQTVDNYQTISYGTESYYFDFKSNGEEKKIVGDKLEITLKDYHGKVQNNTILSFLNDIDKKELKNKDDLILFIKKIRNEQNEDCYIAKTGNYIGNFSWGKLKIDIKSRFSTVFLERMLNFANDVYLDDLNITGNIAKNSLDISKHIIYYMFIQNLEKAFLLGIPKSYITVKYNDTKLKGRIDINRFIKYDIPFKGKVSSISREQKEVQEIIDILYKSVKIIENNEFNTKNISHIKTFLKQHKSNKLVTNTTISKAIKSKVLQNPIFVQYKKVLEYAKHIINGDNIKENENGKKDTYGFLIDVAELFEIYITKLLVKEFPDWDISSPRIELYPNQFFVRKIIPDIVMIKENEVMVFDTKYKRMKMRGTEDGTWDLDRNDFFQINTYMSYYQNHENNYHVRVGGLLYPIEKEFNKNICHSENWFDNKETKFIIDGIDLSTINSESEIEDIKTFETAFIDRIKSLI